MARIAFLSSSSSRSSCSWPLLLLLLLLCGKFGGFLCSRWEGDETERDLCLEIVRKDGYPCESYTVTTEDGFLLGLHRITAGYEKEEDTSPRQPVFLQHGLLQGGDTWVLNSRDQSLGYILADEGFDVWIGSSRCTQWSHGHISYAKKDKESWDWSWDELAAYDIPAFVQFVYSTTGFKVFYVGHSQGTIIGLAAFTQKTVVDFLAGAALLSPITYLSHITSTFVNTAAHSYIEKLVKTMGMHEFNLRSDVGVELMERVCASKHVDCENMLASITGPNCCFNTTRIPYYLEYEPHSTSVKNLAHLAQMIRDGTYCKYDYGFLGNLRNYFRISPPKYDLADIPQSLPLWMAYGGNDALSDGIDAAQTLAELPSDPLVVVIEDYGHIDFILADRAKNDLYDSMIAFFRSQTVVAAM
ncbi:unnamed protein product [Calypogeia fissa]